MKLPRIKTLLLIPVYLFAAFYLFGVILNLVDDREVAPLTTIPTGSLDEIAIFGASGTAGDGILKAALADPDVGTIHVITRRSRLRPCHGSTGKRTDCFLGHWHQYPQRR